MQSPRDLFTNIKQLKIVDYIIGISRDDSGLQYLRPAL